MAHSFAMFSDHFKPLVEPRQRQNTVNVHQAAKKKRRPSEMVILPGNFEKRIIELEFKCEKGQIEQA